ncbi:MAG TPA: glycosyltransferase family 4 protein, partial [Chloroflexia bacterium]|nr:glycosyltransferase family 4 protein [Chloroflexia bacterium]
MSIRVAYVCADAGIPVFGSKGASVHVQEVTRALLGRGARVTLFAARTGGQPPEGLEGVTVCDLPSLAHGERADRERAAFEANGRVREAISQGGPFDMVYERYSLWSYAGMEYAHERGIPGLLEVNAPLIEEQAEHRGLVHRELAEEVAERAFGAATALLAVSREVAAYLEAFPSARGRIHVVPNGVNPERFEGVGGTRDKEEVGTFTVGFVGTLKPWHGLPVLVEAFDLLCRHAQEARLLIVGEGPERETMQAELERRGLLRQARFTGAVAPHEVPQLLADMDVAVAPYPNRADFYFSPLKVYEYMAAGRPV